MKKMIDSLPFILLVALVGFSFHKEPNVAQSLILIAVAGLAGYRYYSIDQEKPDYLAIFEAKIELMEKVHSAEKKEQADKIREELKFVTEELKNINMKYGKLSIAQQQKTAMDKHVW